MARSRSVLLLLLGVAAAAGVVLALGLLDGEDAPGSGPEVVRGADEPPDGPLGPLRPLEGAEEGRGGPSLVGRPGSEAGEAPERPAKREAVLTVTDAAGVPLAGQTVSVFVDGRLLGHLVTDGDGRIHLTELPAEGVVQVALGVLEGMPRAVYTLDGDALEIRAPNVVSLRVDVVDAETGAYLPHARWVFSTPELRGGRAALDAGAATPILVRPGQRLARPFEAEALQGYVDWDPPWETSVSRYATSLVARHPLRREADVVVQVKDEAGEDVRDAQVSRFFVAGRFEDSPQTGTWLLGGTPLERVPFYAGVDLHVRVETPDGRKGSAKRALPAAAHESLTVDVVVRKQATDVVESLEVDEDRAYEESIQPVKPVSGAPAALVGTLVLDVQRADGSPAAGARVRVPLPGEHRADAEGRLRLEGLLAGEHVVLLDEPGLVPASETVTVVAETEAGAVLREPVGGTIVLTVKDAAGRTLPFAAVRVGQAAGTPWVDLAPDGEQRLDPYADERGHRVLRRLQPGRVRLDAWWGGRRGTVVATVGDGLTEEVDLLVR